MKISFRKLMFLVFSIFGFMFTNLNANEGKLSGGSMHEVPEWFKESFLDISEDISEADANNKHFMIFMDLEGCPYCTKMLNENFIAQNKTSEFIKKYFDVINIDVKGSREIAWDANTTLTEKALAEKLEIQYSPTILFFNKNKEVVVRINGYRNKDDFKYILEFVQGKYYEQMTLSQYLEKITKQTLYTFQENKMFKDLKDLSKNMDLTLIKYL